MGTLVNETLWAVARVCIHPPHIRRIFAAHMSFKFSFSYTLKSLRKSLTFAKRSYIMSQKAPKELFESNIIPLAALRLTLSSYSLETLSWPSKSLIVTLQQWQENMLTRISLMGRERTTTLNVRRETWDWTALLCIATIWIIRISLLMLMVSIRPIRVGIYQIPLMRHETLRMKFKPLLSKTL